MCQPSNEPPLASFYSIWSTGYTSFFPYPSPLFFPIYQISWKDKKRFYFSCLSRKEDSFSHYHYKRTPTVERHCNLDSSLFLHFCFITLLSFHNFNFVNRMWFNVTVTSHTCTSRDNLTNDNIFFKSKKMVFLTTDRCVCEDTGCFLEGSRRQETDLFRSEALGNTHKDWTSCRRNSTRNKDILVGICKVCNVHQCTHGRSVSPGSMTRTLRII